MTNPEAFAVLEAAVRSREAQIRTPDVDAALAVLEPQAYETWPFQQFRIGLESEGDTIAAATGRRQVLTASLNGIRRVCGNAQS